MWALAKIMAIITRHPRNRVILGIDFQWSTNSYIGNLFRAYEMIFGVRSGVKLQTSGYIQNIDGVVTTYEAYHTLEAHLVAIENLIRRARPFPIKVHIPVFITPQGFPIFASPYLFAIAFDNVGSAVTAGNSTSTALTTAGSNEIIMIGGQTASAVLNNLSATVGGSAATGIASSSQAGAQMRLFYFVGTSAGSNTVATSSANSGGLIEAVFSSYSGASQTGQPDNSTFALGTGLTAKAQALTTVADNCWTVLIMRWDGAGITAGTGSTLRVQSNSGGGLALLDSNTLIHPAGSYTMNMNQNGGSTNNYGLVMASFSPQVASGPANVKTWDAVTQSTGVKTYFALALASVKSVMGVS